MKLTAFRFYFLPVFLILCGCVTNYVPSEHEIGANRIPPFKPSGSVRLTNAQESSDDVSVSVPGVTTVTVNYRQYTEFAIKLLKGELEKKGVAVLGNAAKEIRLAIVDLKLLIVPGTTRCLVNFTVKTGDGYVRGKEVIGANWYFKTAIDMALANVAIGILNDEKFLDYLEKQLIK